MNNVFQKEKQNDLTKLYTGKIIPFSQKLKYLFIMPCVNRLERNAIQVIEQTFQNFENNNLFDNIENVEWKFLLLESGSKDLSYLKNIYPYFEKYKNNINIIYSQNPLDGPKNIYRIFDIALKLKENEFDFIIWMDDDIVVCNNFLKNCDYWIRNYMNFTIFGSLYSPYHSFPVPNLNSNICKQSFVRSYHGSCCTIFKPILAKYIVPLFFKTNLLRNVVEPDLRFRESIMKFFPNIQHFLVSYPSLVYHLNIGSAIYGHQQIKKGHQCKEFIGTSNDPKWYLNYDFYKEKLKSEMINKNITIEIQSNINKNNNNMNINSNEDVIIDNNLNIEKDNIKTNKIVKNNSFLNLFNFNIDMDISRY